MTIHISRIEDLVSRLEKRTQTHKRSLIAIAGIPGAGKSTLVERLAQELIQRDITCKVFPQDGYHYYREKLAEFEDPEEAFRRRGAPFTFDSDRFIGDIEKVRDGQNIWVPLFDHSKKDPVEHSIEIPSDTQVILVEGNYVGLDDEPWAKTKNLCDELWFLDTDHDLVRERIIKRHVSSGVARSVEEATERALGLDWQNALYVLHHTRIPDVVIRS